MTQHFQGNSLSSEKLLIKDCKNIVYNTFKIPLKTEIRGTYSSKVRFY